MDLTAYFSSLDLDVRKYRIGTFMDQKVTPDVLCAVSECIIYLRDHNVTDFTKNTLMELPFSQEIVSDVFHKPEILKAQNEYDKFFSQPLRMLVFSGVLNSNKVKNEYQYNIRNNEILEFISMRERNSLLFIQKYIEKVLKDSGIFHLFENFLSSQTATLFEILKAGFVDFMLTHTPKKKELESKRIFTKILNPLAYKDNKLGTRKGKISDTPITLDEIFYNRPNWRDFGKDKSVTRKEAKLEQSEILNDTTIEYRTTKAKRFVKSLHNQSEVHRTDPTVASQAHHIFMASEFPELSDVCENIICLTPNQHFNLAHPNKTTVIDKHYQIICLLAKLDSIEEDERSHKGNYYLTNFIDVLNTGFKSNRFDYSMSYEMLKHQLVKFAFDVN